MKKQRTISILLSATLVASVFAAASELSGSETKAQRESRLVPQLLCEMLKSEDVETAHKALRVISNSHNQDNTGYPQTIPQTIVTLRRLLERGKDDEADTRRLACGVLYSYRARIAVPVLVEALADPYEETSLVGHANGQVHDVRDGAWQSADAALRNITGANPIDRPRPHNSIQGQREKVEAAWRKWYRANTPKPAKDKPELLHITIRGWKSGPIWAMMNREGSVMWTGFGPPCDDSAVKRFVLTERLTEKVLSAAERLGPQAENVKYLSYGGNPRNPRCVFVLQFKKEDRRIHLTDRPKNDPSDALRDLYRLLWETRLAKLPGSSSTVATLAPHTTSAVVAVAEAEAQITRRHSITMSTGADGGIKGGGTRTSVSCRQQFTISEVLAGSTSTGRVKLAYGFNEESDVSPGPSQEIAIPIKTRVILLLGVDERILKAMHDNPSNRNLMKAELKKARKKTEQLRSERSAGPVTYRGPSEDTCGTSLYRELPHLKSGSQFSFIGMYDETSNMVRFLNPPHVLVTWHSDTLGDRLQNTSVGYVTNLAELKGLKDKTTARFRAVISPNQPDVDYHEKEDKRIHHFNLKLSRDFEIIPVKVSRQDLLQILKAQASANKATIESFCRKVGVPHVFDPDGRVPGPSPNVKYGWYDGNLAVTSVVSPLPVGGPNGTKRKFVRMSVLVAPDSGKVQEIILAEKLNVYPRD